MSIMGKRIKKNSLHFISVPEVHIAAVKRVQLTVVQDAVYLTYEGNLPVVQKLGIQHLTDQGQHSSGGCYFFAYVMTIWFSFVILKL